MKNNVLKCFVILFFISMFICVLSMAMVSRAEEKISFNDLSSNTLVEDQVGTVSAYQRILQAFLMVIQLIIIGVVFILVIKFVVIICLKTIAKFKSKKEISESFTKEQKEEAEKKYNNYTMARFIRLIIIIVVLLFVFVVIRFIWRWGSFYPSDKICCYYLFRKK